MNFYEFGEENRVTIMLSPGTKCHWKNNFDQVIPLLQSEYHVICVSYDGFDETEDTIYPDTITPIPDHISVRRTKVLAMTIHMVIFQVFFSGVRGRWDAEMPAVIFIWKKWINLSNVEIICLDYGEDMFAWAKAQLEERSSVSYIQGGRKTTDFSLSMKPSKNAAFSRRFAC